MRAAPLPAAERRAAILAAVVPVLLEHGDAVTTRQLAEAAGVSEGTIFNVFADKAELVNAVFEAAVDPEPFELALEGLKDWLTFEDRLIAATTIIQHRTLEIWKLLSAIGPKLQRRPHPIPDSAAMTALFAAEPDRVRFTPDVAARRLRAITLALTHPMMSPTPASPTEIVDIFMNGAAPR